MNTSAARDAVSRRAHESALEVFKRLPLTARRFVTHRIAPGYSAGAVGVCVNADGRVLLVRSRHQRAWSLPGGLLKRGETPEQAVVRELGEEIGVTVAATDLGSTPRVVVDPESRQVTVVFTLTLDGRPEVDGVETVELGWYAPVDLPTVLVRGTVESLRLVAFFQ